MITCLVIVIMRACLCLALAFANPSGVGADRYCKDMTGYSSSLYTYGNLVGKCCSYEKDEPQLVPCKDYPRGRVYLKCSANKNEYIACCEGKYAGCAGKKAGDTCRTYTFRGDHFIEGFEGGTCIGEQVPNQTPKCRQIVGKTKVCDKATSIGFK